jgi:hypothetical protein
MRHIKQCPLVGLSGHSNRSHESKLLLTGGCAICRYGKLAGRVAAVVRGSLSIIASSATVVGKQ